MSEAIGAGALGVDVGGTFTDCVVWDGEALVTAKVPSTADQAEGVIAGAGATGRTGMGRFIHGTTVATNALLERSGANTALITDDGFTDVLEIGRQDRPSLYDTFADRPPPLVPADRRIASADVTGHPALAGVDAVAICLLHAYRDPAGERAIRDDVLAEHPQMAISISSEVAPEIREFERTSTTVLNAYLSPAVAGYLSRLVERGAAAGLPESMAVMRSSGGLISVAEAARLPASVVLSGPAGGVVAAAAVGAASGRDRVISFDMGGTSTDVCRIEGGVPEVGYQRDADGYPCLMPSVAIHTVGAGGGSLAWVDAGGSLRVGPQSAGADPGPASYGRGGTGFTVTDANVLMGRIDPSGRLAGGLTLDGDLALAALAPVSDALGLDHPQTALGVVAVVEEVMAAAIRKVSIEQGADPRRAHLVAFGGAGGLHASSLARRLDMAGVLIPPHAGVFSALGLLLSPPRADASQTVLIEEMDAERLPSELEAVAERATRHLHDAIGRSSIDVEHLVDVRYRGQSHEIAVTHSPGAHWEALASAFHSVHAVRNGFARPEDPIEAVTVRAVATGAPMLQWTDLKQAPVHADSVRASRPILTAKGSAVAEVRWRPGLMFGDEVIGPAVIEEPEATTYIGQGERAVVLRDGTIEVTW